MINVQAARWYIGCFLYWMRVWYRKRPREYPTPLCHPYINHFVVQLRDAAISHFLFNNTITKYSYIGMNVVLQHYGHTFETSNLNFQFQCEFSSVTAEW